MARASDSDGFNTAEQYQRALDTGMRYKNERDEARREAVELKKLVRRAAPFVNAVAVMAEDRTPSLAWLADAAKACPRTVARLEEFYGGLGQ